MSFRLMNNGTVTFKYGRDAPCPCGSRRPAYQCCLTTKGFQPKECNTSPVSTKTGIVNPKCYASALADCSHIISKEHYISKSVLKEMNKRGDLRVRGFSWQQSSAEQILPPEALSAKVLCVRHNNILSNLDDVALRLFRALSPKAIGYSGEELNLFAGLDVERWILKVLCGLLFSRNLPTNANTSHDIPKQWVEILFGRAEFANGQGIYFPRDIGHSVDNDNSVAMQAIYRDDCLVGLAVRLCGQNFNVLLEPLAGLTLLGNNVVYRPLELHMVGPSFEQSIILFWPKSGGKGTISMNWQAHN